MTQNPVLTHSGSTAVAGIIGWPVVHSQSPRLHGFWLAQHRIDGAYIPLAVPPGRLPEAIRGLAAFGFKGANVTIPYKQAVIPLIDEVSDVARRIGAVNTLTVRADGTIAGTNTDAQGFIDNLRDRAPGWRPVRPAVVVGAGGAARAVCAALIDAGVPYLVILNRTVEKAQAIAADVRIPGGAPIEALPLTADTWAAAAASAGLVVNTTSLGMVGHPPLDLDLGKLPADAAVADVVYAPLETPFLAAACRIGLQAVDGLGMLLFQGRQGFAAWYGAMPDVTPELRAFVLQGISG